MTYYQALKVGLSYIEDHLEEELTVEAVAKSAGYSQFHYSRLFSNTIRCSIYDYIMKRKLTAACHCLLERDLKIVDVAFKYGFGSHESFTRAFKKLFGVSPSSLQARHLSKAFEAIEDDYLDYLYDLKIEKKEEEPISAYFIGHSVLDMDSCKIFDASLLLITQDTDPPLKLRYVLVGDYLTYKPKELTYDLGSLTCYITLSKSSFKNTYRFLREIIFKDPLDCNYILLEGSRDKIKVYQAT